MVQAADILGGFAGLISIFLFYLAVLNGCWPGVCSWRDGHQDMPLFGGRGRGASCVLWGWPPAPCGVGGVYGGGVYGGSVCCGVGHLHYVGFFFLGGGGGLWGVCVLWSWPPAPCGVGGGGMEGLCVVELATCTMWGGGGVYGGSVCCGVGHLHHVGLGEGMGWRRGAGLCGWGWGGGVQGGVLGLVTWTMWRREFRGVLDGGRGGYPPGLCKGGGGGSGCFGGIGY